MTRVEFKDMCFGYDAKIILDNINLVFDEPGLICVLGPNGVGKTTLVKCINKLLVPVSGCVELDGQDVHKMSYYEMAQHLAYVPNTSGSVFSMTVAETILMGRHPKAGWTTSEADMDAVVNAIEVLGLQEFSNRDVRALSAGQVQRVMIARGLVQEPEVLILDEPTSNLDVKYQMGVMKFLKAYARDKGIIVIMVCHDLNITAAYADRVILVYDRRVYADGSAKEVLTAENIEEVYKVKAKVNEIDGVPHIFLVPEYDRGDSMEKNKMIMIVVAVVVIVAIAAAAVVLTKGNGGGGGGGHEAGDRVGEELKTSDYPNSAGRLWVYGNANEDDRIDSTDVTYLEGVISGKNKKTQLCDANADGVVDQKDVEQVKAMINAKATTEMTVYYVDNYFRVAKVDWPVNTIATGFSSGYYAAEVAQVVDKIRIVDEMMGDGWKYLNSHTKDLPSFGDEESPDWEAIIAADVDVYVPGWCEDKADKLAPSKLKGMDVMFMNTSDNWYVKFPNEYIDRSLTTFGYLVQGNMTQVYKWLAWHDGILTTLKTASATIADEDKATMIQARNPPSKGESGRYLFIGYNQTNSIHAEWAGVYSIAQHDALLKDSNYPKITMENVKTIIDRNGDKDGRVFFVDNENAGVVQYRDLDVCQADWISSLGKTDNEVVWLGISREMGNSALYLIEMIFYQNVMYPGLTDLDYEEELNYFIDTFISEPDTFRANMHADQWFRSPLDD